MLKRLTIQNYALIESLDISFPEHLIIITGETGAGKSILFGALSLLLGAKADSSVLNNKEKNCIVEAEFEDGEEIILRRVISPQGRSRMFLNDEPIGIEDLKEISSKLVDIHAQHQQLLLSDKKFQLSVLDYFSGNTLLLESYNNIYSKYLSLQSQLKDLDRKVIELEKSKEYKQFQYNQLVEAQLVDGELEELENEQKQLANAEDIKNNILQAASLFNQNEISVVQNLKEAESLLHKVAAYIPDISELVQRLSSSRIELKDIECELSDRGDKVVASPERLLVVDERIAVIYNLFHKHDVYSVSELISIRENLSCDLEMSVDCMLEREKLGKKITSVQKECSVLADQLHCKRIKASKALSETLQRSIKTLEMPHAIFEVKVIERDMWAKDGKDDVLFYFSANGSSGIKELSRCASGGELSRIMLCIKALMAKYVGMPTMIFDEIDTGVSGSIADKMGELIGEMGENMQVFAITHLPQVASKGSAHYLVYKEFNDKNEAKSGIKQISGEERILEIARMLSGTKLSDAAIANAKVLLGEKN
ncbi:MAG: DNA repair protein RecN [Bacteroidales bacterium]|nr:DNA repair protein RecN [Bacteroidales bacterium]